jgi:hypothetical protein
MARRRRLKRPESPWVFVVGFLLLVGIMVFLFLIGPRTPLP